MENKKFGTISLSGGLDSSTLLLKLLSENYQVIALSFDYDQKHKVELERAKQLVNYINDFYYHKKGQFPPIKHQIIKIDGLSQLLNSSLVEGGSEVPEGHYEDSNMSKTVVENRNKIFSSIIQSVALATANKNNSDCVIAMGIHAGDHLIYKDCRAEFRDADYKAFLEGNENGERVKYYTPYLNVNKFEILQDGEKCCEELGLDFDEVYKRTNTSYKPIFIPGEGNSWIEYNPSKNGVVSEKGTWASDFKSASSVERVEAFMKLGRKDPVRYAEVLPNGEVIGRPWEEVCVYVKAILNEYNKKGGKNA